MNRSISTWKRTRAGTLRRGFTLVELLVVIAIIGVLVGLTVPAVFGVRGAFNRASVKFEVQALNDAVENYRSKYGDYPPDGSSWTVLEKHMRKAFPNILQSELNLLNPTMFTPPQNGSVADIRNDNDTTLNGSVPPIHFRVMDPAEALVFFLGGFSSDAQRPFTGPGGPFFRKTVASPYEYNGSRQNPFYEFPSGRLTLDTVGGFLISTDETMFGEGACQGGTGKDLLPVFMSKLNDIATGSPYVYFDSRSYQSIKPGIVYFNFYQPSNVTVAASTQRGALGAARPYLSEQTSALPYENKQTFQILSPGGDGSYGGRVAAAISGPASVILFTSKGSPCSPGPSSFVKVPGPAFILPEFAPKRPMHDNASNFTETNTLGENAG